MSDFSYEKLYKVVYERNIVKTRELIKKAKSDKYEVCVWGAGNAGRTYGKELLEKIGINIDYYCDSNEELSGKEVVDGILCMNRDYFFERKDSVICFVLIGYSLIESAVSFLLQNGIENMITIDDIYELPEAHVHDEFRDEKKQIAVYTCIVGGYDELKMPQYVSDECDYYVVSDKKPVNCGVYTWIDIYSVVPEGITNPVQMNRFCKMHPHTIFPNYKYSIYLDGNVLIKGNMEKFLRGLKGAHIAVPAICFSDDYCSQMNRMIKIGYDKEETFIHQARKYFDEGMPRRVGTFFCTILYREHNQPLCVKVMEDWWEEYLQYPSRDQTSFPYVLWKNGISKEDLFVICESEKMGFFSNNDYWSIERKHTKNRSLPYGTFKF